MCTQLKTALLFFLMTVASNGQAACDSTTGSPPDANLVISLTTADVRMGDFTRPDSSAGASSVTISPALPATQTLPNNLDVNPSGGTNNTNNYHAAEAHVIGGAGCNFQITISNIGAGVSGITLQGKTTSDSLDSTISGAKGTLYGSGTFDFLMGATLAIPDTGGAETINKNFQITVTYVDP